ncbi:MAG: 3-phosphoshikimate 1-carboxyvinyltransferase, partial [Burkholderiales bacterium]
MPLVFSIEPGGALRGELRVPGDKSISHRAIMLGSIAEGVTQAEGLLEGEDVLATAQAFRCMGVKIERPGAGKVMIHGVGRLGLRPPQTALDCGNSGTSMRLLAGMLAAQRFDSTLTGDDSLRRRPMERVAAPLRSMGAEITTDAGGRPPLRLQGGAQLHGIDYALPVASAQVKSAVLLAGLYAEGNTCVTEAAPTRDHTERMLQTFAYPLQRGTRRVCVEGSKTLHACRIDIPADISSAAFFMVGASIAPGSDITLLDVGINPTRTGVIDI